MKLTLRRRSPLVFATTTLTVSALVLAACSGGGGGDGGGGGSEDDPQADGPVDLRMTMWSGNEAHHAIFEQIADAYIAENPDLVSSVEFDAITEPGQYVPTVTTQIAGGEAPDLMWVTEAYALEFVDSGVFADVAPVFDDTEGYDADDLVPGAMELWTKDDATYAYPFSTSPFGIYVNLDLVTAASQPNPRDLIASGEWTWDKLAEIAAATAASQSVAGLQLAVDDPYAAPVDAILPIGLAWGSRPWSEDGSQCEFTSDESKDFFEWFHTQVFDAKAIPGPGETTDFAAGQAAFRMGQLSMSAGFADAFTWDFLPLPDGPAGAVPVVGQGAVGVVADSPNAEVAADFLAYFTNPENAALLAQFFPPPRESLLNVETLQVAAPALTEEQIQGTVIDQALDATTKVGHPRLSQMADGLRAALDPLWTPDADVEAVLTDVCSAIEPTLAE